MSTVAGGNAGRIFVKLKPRNERGSIQSLVQDLRARVSQVPGINGYPQVLPTIRIGGQLTKSQYQFTMQSPDTKVLYDVAPKLEARLHTDPKLRNLVQDVNTDLQITNPQVDVQIDRDKASALGVTAQQIEDALYTAYGQRQISTIYAPSNTYRVVMELEDQYQKDPSALSLLYVRASTGQLVPLNTVATLNKSLGPLSINHLGQLPAVTVRTISRRPPRPAISSMRPRRALWMNSRRPPAAYTIRGALLSMPKRAAAEASPNATAPIAAVV